MKKQKISLNQQIHSLHLKNPLQKNVKRVLAYVMFPFHLVQHGKHASCFNMIQY